MRRRVTNLMVVVACLTGAPVAARAQAKPTGTLQQQVDKLAAALRKSDSTIARLEARLAKMERDAERDDSDKREEAEKAEEAKEKADIERRLSALERAPAGKEGNTNSASRTVRAPFVVEDADGSVILRVTGGKSPRLTVGVDKAGGVEVGTGSAGGGVLRVRDATGSDRALLIGSDGFGQVRLLSQGHSAVLTSNAENLGATLSLFANDIPTARMRSGLKGNGSLILTNPAGTELVVAGTQEQKCAVGIVMTGPRKRAGTMGPSSMLSGAC